MTTSKARKGQVVPRETRQLTPFEEMDRLFNRLFEGGLIRPFDWLGGVSEYGERMPRVDVVDRENEVLVRAELPGIDKEHLEVTLSGETLTIKGESHQEAEEKGEYFRAEIRHGSFARTVHLPAMVDSDKTQARFHDGVLEISIPKREQAVRHRVPIE